MTIANQIKNDLLEMTRHAVIENLPQALSYVHMKGFVSKDWTCCESDEDGTNIFEFSDESKVYIGTDYTIYTNDDDDEMENFNFED